MRESVGIWDESPLRKWFFKGPDSLARRRPHLHVRHGAPSRSGQCRYGPFCDEQGQMLGDGVVYRGKTADDVMVVTALDTDVDHFRRVTARPRLRDHRAHVRASRTCRCRGRARASCSPGSPTPTSRRCATSASSPSRSRSRASRAAGCRAPATRASSATRCSAPPPAPSGVWQGLLDAGAHLGIRPYGLAAVESLRIEAGLIFLGYDYFQGVTSPFHVNLDRMIKLEKTDFVGRAALEREHAAGITHRMVTLVIAGEEAPEYSTPGGAQRPPRRQAHLAVGRALADRRPADRDGVASRPSWPCRRPRSRW